MSDHDTKSLLGAVAAELSDIRGGLQQAGDLMGEVLARLPASERLAYLARSQAFDVLAQRLDALSGLALAVAGDEPVDSALAALPLAEMADRLIEAAHRRGAPAVAVRAGQAAGDLLLFD